MARLSAWVGRVAGLPTGPLFARTVASVDPGSLNGYALVDLVIAGGRLVAWAQAVQLAAVAQLAHCGQASGPECPPVRLEAVDGRMREEVAAALHCTPRGADGLLSLAYELVEVLPTVHAALLAGRIDLLRARILLAETAAVEDVATRATIVTGALAEAGGLTPGQLAARVRRQVLAVDARAARRRRERAVAARRVVGLLEPDGSGTLAGYGLPPERVIRAEARIGAMARAARRSGDPRSLDALRADTMLDLILGEHTPAPIEPSESPLGRPVPAPRRPEPTPTDGCRGGAAEADPDWTVFPNWQRDLVADGEPADPTSHGPTWSTTQAPADRGPGEAGSVNLHLNLTTLLGLDELPGHVGGWGPVLADTARTLAARHRRVPWELRLHDDEGALIDRARLRRHPTAEQAALVRARDITCRAPGCPVPAQRAELDHTIAWAAGGFTTVDNLGALCVRHHHLKHEGGWRLRQPRPGTFTWTSGLGRSYTVRPETATLLAPTLLAPTGNEMFERAGSRP